MLVALDTCVLAGVEDGDDDEKVLHQVRTLVMLRESLIVGQAQLLLDDQYRIGKEYERVLTPSAGLGAKLVRSAYKNNWVYSSSARAKATCLEALKRITFDPPDRVFVAVAAVAGGIYVTSEEKHLTPERREAVFRVCGVRILSPDELPPLLGV